MSSLIAASRRWLKDHFPLAPTLFEFLLVLVLVAALGGALYLWTVWFFQFISVLAAFVDGSYRLLAIRLFQWILLGGFNAALTWFALRKLCGPVLFYDLLRVGRRGRYVLLRTLYVIALFLLLAYVYMQWQMYMHYNTGSRLAQTAEFAEWFFFSLMAIQLMVVLILTPAYLAGCIAEEKDRKTLEFLLATDLRSREIVLSKFLARLLNLTMIVLASIPVISAVQFFGGVDPGIFLASFAALALTMMSLAAVSILMSVHSRKPRDAIVLTYLIGAAYPVFGLIALALLRAYPTLGGMDIIPLPGEEGIWWLNLTDLTDAFNAGNLFWALGELIAVLNSGAALNAVLPRVLLNYAIFHGCLALLCTVWAVARLRPVALKEAYAKPQQGSLALRWFGRPPVGSQPMFWKEVFAESRLKFHWVGRAAVCILVAVSFLPVVLIFYEYLETGGRVQYINFGESMNIWVRSVGTIAAVLLLLAVAVRASSSISGERDKQTLDGLLTTPLHSNNILLAKWAGALLSVRWGWIWLGTIWSLALVTGGLQIYCLPVLVTAWIIYASLFAGVGLWYSAVCRTTLRSTVWTLLTVLFIGGGHWIVMGMCCFLPLGIAGVRERDFEYIMKFEVGQTPPAVLAIVAFHDRDFRGSGKDMLELIGFSLFGLGCWAVAAMVLAHFLAERFQQITNRLPVLVPERPVPPVFAGAPTLETSPVQENGSNPTTVISPENEEDEPEAKKDEGIRTAD